MRIAYLFWSEGHHLHGTDNRLYKCTSTAALLGSNCTDFLCVCDHSLEHNNMARAFNNFIYCHYPLQRNSLKGRGDRPEAQIETFCLLFLVGSTLALGFLNLSAWHVAHMIHQSGNIFVHGQGSQILTGITFDGKTYSHLLGLDTPL